MFNQSHDKNTLSMLNKQIKPFIEKELYNNVYILFVILVIL